MAATLIRLLFIGVFLHVTPGSAQDSFRPARFRGLQLGKAKVTDAIRLLGKPKTILRQSDATWIYYQDLGPAPGRVEIIANPETAVIHSVNVYPIELSLVSAKAIFGPDFRVVRYDYDDCLDIGGSAPMFESKDGRLEFVVYASQGIFIKAVGTRVDSIEYVSQPIGAKQSQCQDKNASKK